MFIIMVIVGYFLPKEEELDPSISSLRSYSGKVKSLKNESACFHNKCAKVFKIFHLLIEKPKKRSQSVIT